MGQQQLLLLVLSTVIVGLATVAGIQAFQQNQAQASQDALTNKAVSVATDIKSLASKPSQLGGVSVDSTSDASKIAKSIGLNGQTFDAPGAGEKAQCKITIESSKALVTCASSRANNEVQVTFDPNASGEKISTSMGSFSQIDPKGSS